MTEPLDAIDRIGTKAFEGYVVRKDLGAALQGPVPRSNLRRRIPTWPLLRFVDEAEIAEGLKIVERQLGEKTVRAGEHELFKARAKDKGHVKLIDIITARLDAATDSFVASLPSLQLKDVRISRADGSRQRANAYGRFLRRGRARLRPDHCPGEERPAVQHRLAPRNPTVQTRSAADLFKGREASCDGGMEELPDSQRRHGAGRTLRALAT